MSTTKSKKGRSKQSARGTKAEFINPRLRPITYQMTSNEKDLAGETTHVRMSSNMIHDSTQIERMRTMFPSLSDSALSRAPKRFLLPVHLRAKAQPLLSVTPAQMEKIDEKSLARRREEEGMNSF